MNNNLTKFKDKKRMNPGIDIDIGDLTEPDDDVEEKQVVLDDKPDVDNDEIDFDSYEIDAMKCDREFLCLIPVEDQYHIMENPIITTCCG